MVEQQWLTIPVVIKVASASFGHVTLPNNLLVRSSCLEQIFWGKSPHIENFAIVGKMNISTIGKCKFQ